ncbi:uncharacterized protein RSE6_12613 [Rhynchosporium secalis]|uniref:Uncharacterized protein n=1 Tax=Rhynchosporium secalis TaxID=38038 RepID=A0A1E1MQV5_RHYSE|nr:uncharacterized protein RSE6_12613 [Rhynchosporium secalis]
MTSLWRRFRSRKTKPSHKSDHAGFGRLVEDSAEDLRYPTSRSDPLPSRRRNSAGENDGNREPGRRAVKFASQANLKETTHKQNPTNSTTPSRASSLSSTDLDYLNAQVAFRTLSPKPSPNNAAPQPPLRHVNPPLQASSKSTSTPRPQVDWEAFSGAFAPQSKLYPSNYATHTMTPQQLREPEGAYAASAQQLAYNTAGTFR